MKLLAILAGASFLLVGTTVGVRMLALARRTRRLPELLLGSGLSALTFVTLPATFVALGLRPGSVALQQALFALGLAPVVGLAMALAGFTAHVFRPRRAGPRAAVVGSGVLAAVGVAGTVASRFAAWEADRVVSAHWSVLIIAVFGGVFLWTAVESLAYRARLTRRVALGLGDPLVCDRLRLWGLGSLGAVVGMGGLVASLLLGWRVVKHPAPVLAIAVAGLSVSVSWWLAFLPPRHYLDRVLRRAASRTT